MKIYDPKKILVPVDFSELSPAIIQAAVEIAELRNAEVDLLHVANKPYYPSYYDGGFPGRGINPNKFREDALTRLESQLEVMARKIPTRAKVKTTALWGDPIKEIVQVAESGNFDLIVMATHGRKGMNRFFVGSVTEEVIRRTPCPVLAIRAKVVEERVEVSTLEGAEIS